MIVLFLNALQADFLNFIRIMHVLPQRSSLIGHYNDCYLKISKLYSIGDSI